MTLEDLTPQQIVAALDSHIIGQARAKKAVAIALRNRIRRQKLAADLQDEIAPKNIIMIGPTGVGKTEIARRLAKLTGAPFIKVEATKYTEVGYVGRDVESMIRDLMSVALAMVKQELREGCASGRPNAPRRSFWTRCCPEPTTKRNAPQTRRYLPTPVNVFVRCSTRVSSKRKRSRLP